MQNEVQEIRSRPKDDEDESSFLLQGGVSVVGAVQGSYMHQLSKRWSLESTIMSNPPAQFVVRTIHSVFYDPEHALCLR